MFLSLWKSIQNQVQFKSFWPNFTCYVKNWNKLWKSSFSNHKTISNFATRNGCLQKTSIRSSGDLICLSLHPIIQSLFQAPQHKIGSELTAGAPKRISLHDAGNTFPKVRLEIIENYIYNKNNDILLRKEKCWTRILTRLVKSADSDQQCLQLS